MITALSIAQIVAAVDASKKSFDKSMDGMHACNETAQSLQHTPQQGIRQGGAEICKRPKFANAKVLLLRYFSVFLGV
jgi:hypothetical protein